MIPHNPRSMPAAFVGLLVLGPLVLHGEASSPQAEDVYRMLRLPKDVKKPAPPFIGSASPSGDGVFFPQSVTEVNHGAGNVKAGE